MIISEENNTFKNHATGQINRRRSMLRGNVHRRLSMLHNNVGLVHICVSCEGHVYIASVGRISIEFLRSNAIYNMFNANCKSHRFQEKGTLTRFTQLARFTQQLDRNSRMSTSSFCYRHPSEVKPHGKSRNRSDVLHIEHTFSTVRPMIC